VTDSSFSSEICDIQKAYHDADLLLSFCVDDAKVGDRGAGASAPRMRAWLLCGDREGFEACRRALGLAGLRARRRSLSRDPAPVVGRSRVLFTNRSDSRNRRLHRSVFCLSGPVPLSSRVPRRHAAWRLPCAKFRGQEGPRGEGAAIAAFGRAFGLQIHARPSALPLQRSLTPPPPPPPPKIEEVPDHAAPRCQALDGVGGSSWEHRSSSR
jgi:hypothetical protein